MSNITLTVLGARGSMPVSGEAFTRYGGHTTSFVVEAGSTVLVIDAGTALVHAADRTLEHWQIAFTHYHNDHLQGLHFFPPLYESEPRFTFIGYRPETMTLEEAIAGSFEPPFFPVTLTSTPSAKSFLELGDDPITIGDIKVAHARLNHPQGVAAYRLEHGGSAIVVATDHEAGEAAADEALLELAEGADVLFHDAQYTPADYDDHAGWGHSTWEHAVSAASTADVKHLVLTSHDPSRTDEDVDDIVARARGRFPLVSAAYEGMVVSA